MLLSLQTLGIKPYVCRLFVYRKIFRGYNKHEPATVDEMHRFMEEQGYTLDITDQRMHHEIYLSDARRVAPEKLKTVVRHPIRRA